MLDKVITQDIFRAKRIFSQVSTPCLSEMSSQIVLQNPRHILMKRKKRTYSDTVKMTAVIIWSNYRWLDFISYYAFTHFKLFYNVHALTSSF